MCNSSYMPMDRRIVYGRAKITHRLPWPHVHAP